MATIELKNLCKRFTNATQGGLADILHPVAAFSRATRQMEANLAVNPRQAAFAIEQLNLTIPDGKVMVILGPSGCGKSTLLRLVSGLMPVDSGEVLYDGVNVNNVPTGNRGIGMVFQNYALYPHLTSRRNMLSYFLFHQRNRIPELNPEAQEKFQRTSALLGVDIEYLLDRSPAKLSGGEKQRVALGRCITRDPELFLLDEPFSNLDQPLREKYRGQLKKLLKHFDITTIYVTHDQHEALLLADVIAVMNVGAIEQVGAPEEIYRQPASVFVANFLNPDSETPPMNWLENRVAADKLHELTGIIGVRPEDLSVSAEWSPGSLQGRVHDVYQNRIRRTTLVTVQVGESELIAQLTRARDFHPGQEVYVSVHTYHLFDRDTGGRLKTYTA